MDQVKKLTSSIVKSAAKDDDEEALLQQSNNGSKGSQKNDEKRGKSEGDKDSAPTNAIQAVFKSLAIATTLVSNMFRQTTCADKLILIVGTLFAIIHGFTFPFVAVIFGSLTNSYVQQAIHGFANSTSSTTPVEAGLGVIGLPNSTELGLSEGVAGTLELINKVLAQTFSKEQIFTKDEFITSVHSTGLLFCILAAGIFVCSFLQYLCFEIVAVNQTFRIRAEVIKNILRQDLAWFLEQNEHALISHIYGDAERIRDGVGLKFSICLEYFAMFAAAALIAIGTSYRIALVFLLATPFIIYRMLKLLKMLGAKASAANKKWEQAESISTQALVNIDTVMAFGEQEHEIRRYGEKLEESMDLLFKEYHLSSMGNAFLTAIIYGCYAVAFWYSCRLLTQHGISAGEIYTIFLSITMGSIAIQNLTAMVPTVSRSFEASKHMHEFADRVPAITSDIASAVETDEKIFNGDIEFKNINFGYQVDKLALNDLSFTIKDGETVAIVGDAGSGTSTIAYLLLRFYDPASGTITIDQRNLKALDINKLRQNICMSLQEILMSHKSVVKNIRAGRKDIKHAQITDIMSIIGNFQQHAHGPIATRVEDYTALQLLRKIDLARTLLTKPPVVILDESFSDLFESERKEIQDRVLRYRKGKTTIILTNHFARIKDVDRIYVIQDGHIIAQGSHEDLMKDKNSLYAFMVNAETTLEEMKQMPSDGRIGKPHATPQYKIRFAAAPQLEEPQKVSDLVWSLITPETKKMWIVGFVGCLVTGFQMTVLSAYFVEIFGTFSTTGAELANAGIFWAGMLIALAMIAALGIWLKNLFAPAAGLYFVLGLKVATFTSILRRPKLYFDKSKETPSELGFKMMRKANFVKSAVETAVANGVSALVTIFFICILIFILVWQIGLIALLGVLPSIVLLAVVQYKLHKHARKNISQKDDKSSEAICKALEQIKLTQAYCMQGSYLDKYFNYSNMAFHESRTQAIKYSLVAGLCESIFFLFCGSSFLYGTYLVQVDAIDPQSLFKIFFAVAFCIALFRVPVAVTPDLAEAMFVLEITNDLLNEETTFDSSLDALNNEGEPLETVEGRIVFQHVNFEYSNQREVLKGFDLNIPAGKTIGLTGRCGFGGSTILQLIMRFYDPSGNLCIDGSGYQDRLRNFNIRQLREKIGWVPEEIALFEGSLAHNIQCGYKQRKKITAAQMEELLDTVQLGEDFKQNLNVPHDTHYWNTLSRGKKVQIAIARAMLRKPKILLIDSPTDSLAGPEEATILDVISTVKQSQTTIIVSKVPSTISYLADIVAIISDGKVVKYGSSADVHLAPVPTQA